MKKTAHTWKTGRGKLGTLAPLIGSWEAKAETPLGRVRCTRSFTPVLGGTYVQLIARWKFKKGIYAEQALFGVDENRKLAFWSFTSDGKHSQGAIADASDIPPQTAIMSLLGLTQPVVSMPPLNPAALPPSSSPSPPARWRGLPPL